MARSKGVTIYGVYALVFGSINGVSNLVLAIKPELVTAMYNVSAEDLPDFWLLRMLGAALIGFLLFGAGLGCFGLKRWGRTLAVVVSSTVVMLSLINLFFVGAVPPETQGSFMLGSVLAPVLLNGGLLWFFTRPTVVAQFRPPESTG